MNSPRFESYLKDKSLAPASIREHLKNIIRFETWKTEGIEIKPVHYHEILSYVQSMKDQGLSAETQNIRLNSLRKYFEYLKEEGIIEINPVRDLHIKGGMKRIVIDPLTYEELQSLYEQYSQPRAYRESWHSQVHERNSVIVSLVVCQGVHSGELNKIERKHIHLEQGRIYLPATRRSNSRELKLESQQIILLYRYLTEREFKTDQLFECHPYNTMQLIVAELKKINPKIRNAMHLRASVLLHWLKVYNKRQVQYMAGHKWISSTEHYHVQDLEGLTEWLTRHHPFS